VILEPPCYMTNAYTLADLTTDPWLDGEYLESVRYRASPSKSRTP
jgi:hypothetical protein